MLRNYSPIDLRKASAIVAEGVLTKIFHESEIISSGVEAENFYQDDGLKDGELGKLFTQSYRAPEVYFSEIENCTIGPRLVGFTRYWPFFFGEHYVWNFLSSSAKDAYQKANIFEVASDIISWDKERYPALKIPGVSVWFYPFGNLDHFLRECLPSILLLKESGIGFSEINFICSEINPSFYSLLIDIGIPASSIIVTGNRWIECERLILPCFGSFGHLHSPSRYYTKILDEVLERISSEKAVVYERVYVSRRRAKMRRVINEGVMEDGLVSRGFHIVDPGDYSVKEQINIFKNASLVLGPHGMGIANYAFSKKEANLFEIMQSNCPRVSYYRTAQLKRGKYAAYWVPPVPLEFCNDGDVYGDVLINSKTFFNALDEFV